MKNDLHIFDQGIKIASKASNNQRKSFTVNVVRFQQNIYK